MAKKAEHKQQRQYCNKFNKDFKNSPHKTSLKKKKVSTLEMSDFALPSLLSGFPDSSVGKESICNAGDTGSIPGSGRSAGEGIGYPLQYSWASLLAQLIKNPPAMPETWVRSLGWEDLLEKGRA